jgi:hypothetical protein
MSVPRLPEVLRWSVPGRAVVFVLSAMSIWCLLAEFYGFPTWRSRVVFPAP